MDYFTSYDWKYVHDTFKTKVINDFLFFKNKHSPFTVGNKKDHRMQSISKVKFQNVADGFVRTQWQKRSKRTLL